MTKKTDPHDLAWQLANRVSDTLNRADALRATLYALLQALDRSGYDAATVAAAITHKKEK